MRSHLLEKAQAEKEKKKGGGPRARGWVFGLGWFYAVAGESEEGTGSDRADFRRLGVGVWGGEIGVGGWVDRRVVDRRRGGVNGGGWEMENVTARTGVVKNCGIGGVRSLPRWLALPELFARSALSLHPPHTDSVPRIHLAALMRSAYASTTSAPRYVIIIRSTIRQLLTHKLIRAPGMDHGSERGTMPSASEAAVDDGSASGAPGMDRGSTDTVQNGSAESADPSGFKIKSDSDGQNHYCRGRGCDRCDLARWRL
ncbi:hypothetical protein HO133_002630 [Letharia lupina]|uniref:Uncharacterized protein n=1 Tax=Letharia lupina TaxID=560253 RepID=A0A8H6CCI9_9LECA|nr:uncharacterized protein HO133_002630 [Letharia lupina]KAF6220949.1 hypothetical protein HO133_002630 [Letharia lupina]